MSYFTKRRLQTCYQTPKFRDVRWNKGTILKAAVEHIRKLQARQVKQMKQEQKMQKMERINRSLILRVQELEGLISQQGIDMPPMDDKDEIIGYLGGNPGKGKHFVMW